MNRFSRTVTRALLPTTLLVLGLLASGCAPVYTPNTVQAPMLRAAGDVQASAYATTNGVDTEVAVAMTDRWSAAGAFSFGESGQSLCLDEPSRDCSGASDDARRHRFGEVSLGYKVPLFPSSDRPHEGGFADFRAGYGRGWAEAFDTYEFLGTSRIEARGQYERIFVQPGGYVDRGFMQFHHAWRFSFVNLYAFESDDIDPRTERHALFWEPATTLRIGPDPIVLVAQASLSLPLQQIEYDYTPMTISFGATIRLSELFRTR